MAETRISLIQRVRNKEDSDAWAQFFAIYRPLLTAYVRKRGVSEHDAADVVQDVFARLIPALPRFEFDAQRGRFRTWLWRVTHNALADWGRHRATRNQAERGWVDLYQPDANDESDAEWNELYRRRILEIVTERVRASTQPVTWACFEGRILAGRPAAEIADETGVSVNAVYVNASRVMARVREECEAFQEP
ncbi:MAG: rpoE 1 [Planctomycetaceae bacterium]|nr:rpoE 1 [Planctomycetaceae bacterium]